MSNNLDLFEAFFESLDQKNRLFKDEWFKGVDEIQNFDQEWFDQLSIHLRKQKEDQDPSKGGND